MRAYLSLGEVKLVEIKLCFANSAFSGDGGTAQTVWWS